MIEKNIDFYKLKKASKELSLFKNNMSAIIEAYDRVYLFAAPSMGKSTFIKMLAEYYLKKEYHGYLVHRNNTMFSELKNDNKLNILSGSIYDIAEEIRKIEIDTINANYFLFFDDIDYFLFKLFTLDVSDKEIYIKRIMDKLQAIKSRLRDWESNRIIITAKHVYNQFLTFFRNKVDENNFSKIITEEFYRSEFLTDWEEIHLFPLNEYWKEQFEVEFNALFSEFSDLENTLKKWYALTCELSGGHPYLIRIILVELIRLLEVKMSAAAGNIQEKKQTVKTEFIDHDCNSTKLRYYIEDILIQKGIIIYEQLLRDLKNFNVAYEQLRKIAYGTSEPVNLAAAKILLQMGLIVQNPKTLQYEIINKLLRDTLKIQNTSKPENHTIRFIIKPDTKEPDKRGELIMIKGNKEVFISLSSIQWQITKILYEANGNIVSYEEIKKTIPNKIPAIRSVIMRLKQKLKRKGFPPIIKNTQDEGYSFSRFK